MIKIIYLSLALICVTAVTCAAVRPVTYDSPLALRSNSMPNLWSQTGLPRQLDDWNNLRINSDTTGQVQNEEQIVCNPTNPDNLVAVWRDFRLGYRRIGVGYSLDGGRIWSDQLFTEPTYPWQSDPGLTYHSSGAIYAIVLSLDPYGEDGLFVARSLTGGLDWEPFYPAVNAVYDAFEDKELIACDRSGSQYDGYLYIAWTRFTELQSVSRITMVRSTDAGISWDLATPVSDNTGVQWSVPAVGPNGEVYIGWVNYSPAGVHFDRSFDGGVTWGTDLVVQPTNLTSAYINPQLLIFAYPAMDVDITPGPKRGNIYIAYTDDWYGDTDIIFTSSSDSGSHWSAPLRVNDDAMGNGADQFHPWLVCDEEGILHLIFYDRRLDVPQNLLMDLFYTHSEDGGLTWAANQRITDVSSNPALDSTDSGLIGEYNGLDVRNGVIHPIWTDTRNGHQDAFTAVWMDSVGIKPMPTVQLPAQINVQTHPNPFNPQTVIRFQLPNASKTRLEVLDVSGRLIATLRDGWLEAGLHEATFDGSGLASGIYIYRLRTGEHQESGKMLLLK